MNFHITKLSTYAKQIIQNTNNGFVHSVYRNTINIMVNGCLLALQTANSPLSPISLITDLHSDEFAQLSLTERKIIFFDYSKAEIFSLSPQNGIAHHIRHDLYKKFSQIIRESDTDGFDLIFQFSPKVNDDFILTAAERKIHKADTLFRQGNFKEAAKILCEMIGLGIGLTPSGDDFLCGMLAGLHIQGKADSEFAIFLRDVIENNLHQTNEISAAFLSCALDGHFSLAVNELWKNPDVDAISQAFHAIGHSSGMDTLCGIYFLFFLME